MRRDAFKEDSLGTMRIRRLRVPIAMILEHPDEFVRTIIEAIGTAEDQERM
jgi:hypothetical protein